MADLPTTYSTGTITVGANSTTVTGAGTAWATSGIRAGDMLLVNGLQVRVATVVSNTQLTLSRGWPGSAVSAGNYDILLIDDGVRSLVASNNLLQALLGNGSLAALGGLSGSANKLPYFQGAGSMAMTDLSSFARSLLNDTDADEARATLGLAKQTSSDDITAGRMMSVGAFGLGGNAIVPDDLDTAPFGFFVNTTLAAPPANAPVSGDARWVGFTAGHANSRIQIAQRTDISDAPVYIRGGTTGGVWRPWKRLDPANGSNSNGEWTRLGDGTQLAWISGLAASSSGDVTWTYPIPFSSPPSVQGTVLLGPTSNSSVRTAARTATSCNIGVFSGPGARLGSSVDLYAIGRWF